MKRVFVLISLLLCASLARAHESGCFANLKTNQIQTDSVTIISEESKDYFWSNDGTWHYLLVNYSNGTSKMFDQNNNWILFDTEYEMDLITDEKTDKPIKFDTYWNKSAVKNVIAAEIEDENGKMVIKDGAVEYTTPYNLSATYGVIMNERISNIIQYTLIHNGKHILSNNETIEISLLEQFLILAGMSDNIIILEEGTRNQELAITIKGPNGNILKKMEKKPWQDNFRYYDETTQRIYTLHFQYYNNQSNKVYGGKKRFSIAQACSISQGNTEITDILSDDVELIACLPADTINRFVWTDKVCEIYYSNGDYLKYTNKNIDAYSLSRDEIFDCVIHRPDGILTIKLEDIQQGDYRYYGNEEKLPVFRYEYTSGKYKGLINTNRLHKLKYYNVLGVANIIDPRNTNYNSFVDSKTNHKLSYHKDKPDYLYDETLKQYVSHDGKVKDFEKEAREKIEKERQPLYQKYGKKYVDALLDKGEILVGTPEGLVKNHTQSTLINETQYTRTYKIKGWLNDWGASVDVNVQTGKVAAVRNRTL